MKIHVISLGCPKNTVDTEVMLGILERAGHVPVRHRHNADVILINTCGFIEPAKEESLETILDALEYKKENPHVKVIATGCLTQRYRQELAKEMPELDAILGVNQIPQINEIVGNRICSHVDTGLYLYDHQSPRLRITPSHYAYVKISEGCSRSCSFCAIPFIRGPFRSRLQVDILQEVSSLVAGGVREIILIGQDTTAYEQDRNRTSGIIGLLEKLAVLDGDFWIRLLYTYPTSIGEELFETMARHDRICPYLDLPLQHSHPDILKKMGRSGSGDSFLKLLEKACGQVPGLAIRTSLITGFPGEKDTHFQHLLDFTNAAKVHHLGVFCYSDEEGTSAYNLPEKVAPEAAQERRQQLMECQQEILQANAQSQLGKQVIAMVDGYTPGEEFLIESRTQQQAPEIDSVIYLVDGPLDTVQRGDIVPVRILEYVGYDFTAKICVNNP